MTTRMTVHRLAGLIAAADAAAVAEAVTAQPRLVRATVEQDGDSGWTPLHLAVAAGQEAVVEVLVTAGADLSARTEDGHSPLHVALQRAPDLVPLLRRLGAPVDAASAAFLGDAGQLADALDAGAPLTDPVPSRDLLSWAAAGSSAATVAVLLDRGADPDTGALHAAAAAGCPPVVGALLRAGAAVDRRDPHTGRTPLHTAVAALASGPTEEVIEVVRLLLDAGADVNATTNDGASALDITRVAGARRRAGTPGDGAAGATGPDALDRLLTAAGATG